MQLLLYSFWPQEVSYLFKLLFENVPFDNLLIYNYNINPIAQSDSDTLQIKFTVESLCQYNNMSDIHFGHHKTDVSKKRIWFPFILCRDPIVYTKPRDLVTPKYFCGFGVSNVGCNLRNGLFDYISVYRHVHSFGSFKRNTELIAPAIHTEGYIQFLKQFKFLICFENSEYPYYITEKLGNAYLAGCIPIYWGCTTVPLFLNVEAFIHVTSDDSFEDVYNRIQYIDTNEEAYMRMRSQPLFNNNTIPTEFSEEYLVKQIKDILATKTNTI